MQIKWTLYTVIDGITVERKTRQHYEDRYEKVDGVLLQPYTRWDSGLQSFDTEQEAIDALPMGGRWQIIKEYLP